MQNVLTSSFKALPFWWEAAAPQPAPDPIPSAADAVVVGGGYCGLMAAITLARGGRDVVVLDAQDPGAGASSRNHGHIGAVGGKIPEDLVRRVGERQAELIWRDAKLSAEFFLHFLEDEKLEVDFVQRGRFQGAHSASAFRRMAATAEYLDSKMGVKVRLVDRAHQRSEIGSDFYHGGMVFENGGALHPGKLHREYRRVAEAAGAKIRGKANVLNIERQGATFSVTTSRGMIRAKDVLIATNAYTGALTPWLRRRLVPVTAYMAATEELPDTLANELMPTNRSGGDSKRAIYAFRRSPDGRRIIFAGRAKFGDMPESEAANILHGFMKGIWPQLSDKKISHCWKGHVAFTFDFITRMGVHDGMHYAVGDNGWGIVIMTYLGRQMAIKAMGQQTTPCGFDIANFPTAPFYNGNPWFLPAVGAYYRTRDSIDRLLP